MKKETTTTQVKNLEKQLELMHQAYSLLEQYLTDLVGENEILKEANSIIIKATKIANEYEG